MLTMRFWDNRDTALTQPISYHSLKFSTQENGRLSHLLFLIATNLVSSNEALNRGRETTNPIPFFNIDGTALIIQKNT
jgi:hypothetical protein